MKYFLVFFVLLFLITQPAASKGSSEADPAGSEPTSTSEVSAETPRVYPIAPGIWYPGDPLPENPIRYYRVRCWPGCHHGSSHGKYPNAPLGMKPIFPTSTIDRAPGASTDKE
jgi:hypothetical protein